MGLEADNNLNMEEYGLIEIQRVYNYSLPGKLLCYNPENKSVDFKPLIQVELEARQSFYIISTFKQNRVVVTPDTLILKGYDWVLPKDLEPGASLWMNYAKSIVTDGVSEVKLYRRAFRSYIPRMETNLPFFANNILIREQELISDEPDQ